jgi:hypothetical protein
MEDQHQIDADKLRFNHSTTWDDIMTKALDRLRMITWLIFGLALYLASWFAGTDHPFIQTILYKTGHVTTLAWIGYWIARHAIGRIGLASKPTDGEYLARAIIVAGVIIAGSLGL